MNINSNNEKQPSLLTKTLAIGAVASGVELAGNEINIHCLKKNNNKSDSIHFSEKQIKNIRKTGILKAISAGIVIGSAVAVLPDFIAKIKSKKGKIHDR